MDSRVALISIILKDSGVVEELNDILHQYSQYIIGRMGIPYREKNIHIISVAVDAPSDVINAPLRQDRQNQRNQQQGGLCQ